MNLFPRRTLLKLLPASFVGLFGLKPESAAASILPSEQEAFRAIPLPKPATDPVEIPPHMRMSDEELIRPAISFVFHYAKAWLHGIKARNEPESLVWTQHEPIVAELGRLRREYGACGPEFGLFVQRYIRTILSVASVYAEPNLTKLLAERDEAVPRPRGNGTPWYVLKTVTSPTSIADIDTLQGPQDWTEWLWRSIGPMVHYHRNRKPTVAEVDCYVRIEAFEIRNYVWLRTLEPYEERPARETQWLHKFSDTARVLATVHDFRKRNQTGHVDLYASDKSVEAIGIGIMAHLCFENAFALPTVEPMQIPVNMSKILDWPKINEWLRNRNVLLVSVGETEENWPKHAMVEMVGRPLSKH